MSAFTTMPARRGRPCGSIGRSLFRWLVVGVASAVAVTTVDAVQPPKAQASTQTAIGGAAPVTLDGAVDERRAEVNLGFELGQVSGPAGSVFKVRAAYSQQRAAAGMNPYGLGAGWSWGWAFVDVVSGRVALADGLYQMDDSQASGLADYRRTDVQFVRQTGTTPSGSSYASVLRSLADGSTQYFDAAGNLTEQTDAHGHSFVLTWQKVGTQQRLMSVRGPWGSKVVLSWSLSQVSVASPRPKDAATAPTTVLTLSAGRVTSMTDPVGVVTRFEWAAVPGTAQLVLPSAVVSATAVRTEYSYAVSPVNAGSIVTVAKVRVRGAGGVDLVDPVEISVNPDAANGGRNYSGCPTYCPSPTVPGDRLANSGDGGYTYRVRLTQGERQTEHTYNAAHLLKRSAVRTKVGLSFADTNVTTITYHGESTTGAPPKVKSAPADYELAAQTTVTAIDPVNAGRTRKAQVSGEYDDLGRATRHITPTTETTTTYGPRSIPLRIETKDRGTGAVRVLVNTPTEDSLSIAKTEQLAARAGQELQTVSTTEFEYHSGELAGEVSRVVVTGDGNAKGGDPGTAVTTTDTQLDAAADGTGTRTDKVTGPDGVTTTTKSDLATGAELSTEVPGQGTSTIVYDAAVRPVLQESATGQQLRTDYQISTQGMALTQTRLKDRVASTTISDQLGRKVSTTSNLDHRTGKAGANRIIETIEYDRGGQQVASTDRRGRETRMAYHSSGKPSQVTQPDGVLLKMRHDDVAGTVTTQLFAPGEDTPAMTAVNIRDDRDNMIEAASSFRDGSEPVGTETGYDGFDTPVSSRGSGPASLLSEVDAAGRPVSDTIAPVDEQTPQGRAEYVLDAFGREVGKVLKQDGQTVSGWTTKHDAAGRVKQVLPPGADPGTGRAFTSRFDERTGAVASTVQPDDSTVFLERDAAGRLVESWTLPAGADADDASARVAHVKRSYDDVTGQLAAVWDPADEAGTKIVFEHGRRTDPGGKVTTFTYTEHGDVESTTDVTDAVTTNRYDGHGRLAGVRQVRGEQVLGALEFEHNALGQVVRVQRSGPDGSTVSTSSYDWADDGTLKKEKHLDGAGDVVAEHAYTYTGRQLATDVATVRGADGDSAKTATRHTYDGNGRLLDTTVTKGHIPGEGTVLTATGYTWDPAANLKKKVVSTGDGADATRQVTEYRHDRSNRTVEVIVDGDARAQTYDAADRLETAADGTEHRYNAAGQLLSSTNPDSVRVDYTYNALGDIATQQTTTPDSQGGPNLVDDLRRLPGVEIDAGGGTATLLVGHGLHGRTVTPADGGTPQFTSFLADRRGDITHTLDGHGAVTGHTSYTDHGVPTSTGAAAQQRAGSLAANPYGYAGERTSPTGQQSLGQRWYDPTVAAFTSPDAHSAGMMNQFTYATGDPVNLVDPTGRSPEQAMLFGSITGHQARIAGAIALTVVGIAFSFVGGGAAAGIGYANLLFALAEVAMLAESIAVANGGQDLLGDELRSALGWSMLAAGGAGGIAGMAGNIVKRNATKAASRARLAEAADRAAGRVTAATKESPYLDWVDRSRILTPTKAEARVLKKQLGGGLADKETQASWPADAPVQRIEGEATVRFNPKDRYHNTIKLASEQQALASARKEATLTVTITGDATDAQLAAYRGSVDDGNYWTLAGRRAVREWNESSNPGAYQQRRLVQNTLFGQRTVAQDQPFAPRGGSWEGQLS